MRVQHELQVGVTHSNLCEQQPVESAEPLGSSLQNTTSETKCLTPRPKELTSAQHVPNAMYFRQGSLF